MSYKITDEVAMRMIQIFQEAVIFGVDGADLMRQVRLIVDPAEPDSLTLDPAYVSSVEEMHKKYMEEAAAKQTENTLTNSEKLFS
jgi:hypothetical protein